MKKDKDNKKERLISSVELDKVLNEVEDMNPYKESGNRDSYSQYNEGWSDAIGEIKGRLNTK